MSSPTRVANQRQQVAEHRSEIDRVGLQHLLAAERQQLLRQRRGALGGAANLQRLIADRRLRRRVLLDHAGVAEDRGEHVVEVVRDAAGELADRLHLLGLGELPFELALLVLRAAARAARSSKPGQRHRDQQHRGQRQLRQRRPLDLAGHQVVAGRRCDHPGFVGGVELRPRMQRGGRPHRRGSTCPAARRGCARRPAVGATPVAARAASARRSPAWPGRRRADRRRDRSSPGRGRPRRSGCKSIDEREHAVEIVRRRRDSRRWARCATPESTSARRDGTLFAQP